MTTVSDETHAGSELSAEIRTIYSDMIYTTALTYVAVRAGLNGEGIFLDAIADVTRFDLDLLAAAVAGIDADGIDAAEAARRLDAKPGFRLYAAGRPS